MTEKTQNKLHPASFRDPSGFLFNKDGRLYRQINQSYSDDYDRLMDSGLYAALVARGDLLPHEERQVAPASSQIAYRVIEPELLEFISYPYEWSFSELKDAAITTLRVHRAAIKHGMALKDASAFNIQFHRGSPVLVDTLSFEILKDGEPWIAYRQFCQHFLAPIALMALVDIELGKLMRIYIDGVPLGLASRLLPRRTWLRLSLLLHVHWHASAQRRYAGTSTSQRRKGRKMNVNSLLGLVDNLEGAIHRLKWKPQSPWVDYEQTHAYSDSDWQAKRDLVDKFLGEKNPASVWDLGANEGTFSRLASQRGIPTHAFDFDPGAVELNYLRSRDGAEEYLLPLVMDLTNPSPALGWEHRERMSLAERGPAGAILALALVHHLAISNNLPLDRLAGYLATTCQSLLIEFIPKEDPQVKRLLVGREDIFHNYHRLGFESAFETYFTIERSDPIGDSGRMLYWMKTLP